METLESSRVCRLCGKHSGISINIFEKNENHVKKINAVLPIMVHEMDLLPKHMCHRCSYKLEECHKFYVDCLRTDANLKSQLSWMRKEEAKEKIGVPMVHIQNLNIKLEPLDCEAYQLEPIVENVNYMNSVSFPVNGVHRSAIREGMPYPTYTRCKYCCDKTDQSSRTPVSYGRTTTMGETPGSAQDNNLGNPNEVQIGKTERLGQDEDKSRRSTTSAWEDSTGNSKVRRSVASIGKSSSNSNQDCVNVFSHRFKEINPPGSTVVRNLRPRRRSVDYVGPKRKPPRVVVKSKKEVEENISVDFKVPVIKAEKSDDYEGRILRPRRVVDYVDTKRNVRSSIKRENSQLDMEPSKKRKINCADQSTLAARVLKLLAYNDDASKIKQEPPDENNTLKFDGTVSRTSRVSKNRGRITNDFMSKRDNSLPNNVCLDVQKNSKIYTTSGKMQFNSSLVNKLKSLTSIAKKKSRSSSLVVRQKPATNYTSKALRSQDVYLRNGKLRSIDLELKMVKKRRNYAIPTDNIKRYCEKCNLSFANKELYMLHACYV